MRSHEPAHLKVEQGPWMLRLVSVLGALSMAGCGVEPVATYEAETDPARVYAALTLDHRAINLATMAPYHTIQLVATPRDGRGAAMAGLSAPNFRLALPGDTTVLSVTSDGLVTARAAGSRIAVITELTAPGPIRHADTALISVTAAAPPVLDTLSIHPLPSDSAIRAMGVYDGSDQLLAAAGLVSLPPEILSYRAVDPSGSPITDLVVEYESLDPAIATIDRWTGGRYYVRPGSVRFVARTLAYGVAKADTVTFTVTWPLSASIFTRPAATGGLGFVPFEVRIAPHGMVFFVISRNDFVEGIPQSGAVDIVFDDPAQLAMPPAALCNFFDFAVAIGFFSPGSGCGTGNVLLPWFLPPPDESAAVLIARQFPEPGIYPFHSTRTGTTGRVIVTANPEAGGTP